MIKRVFENVIGNLNKMIDYVEYGLLMMCTSFTCSKLLYYEVDKLFLKIICGFLKYIVLAPSNLMYEIIPSIKI